MKDRRGDWAAMTGIPKCLGLGLQLLLEIPETGFAKVGAARAPEPMSLFGEDHQVEAVGFIEHCPQISLAVAGLELLRRRPPEFP